MVGLQICILYIPCMYLFLIEYICLLRGRVAQSVKRLTGTGRPGIESRCGRDLPPFQTGPGAHPASCKMCTWSFPGVQAAGAWG